MRLLKKSLYGLAVAALVLTGVITPASADVREVVSASVPYDTYVYDYNGNPVVTPHAYTPALVFEGEDVGVGAFTGPSDLEVDEQGNLYIVDTDFAVDMSKLTNVAQTAIVSNAGDDETEETADDTENTDETENTDDTENTDETDEDEGEDETDTDTASVDESGGFFGRIVVLNPDYSVKRIITTFQNAEGKTDGFGHPQGVTISHDGTIYVADTDHGRILHFTQSGKLIKEFGAPVIPYMDEKFKYRPAKLAVDGSDNIFVIAISVNYGVILLDEEGTFSGFVGAQQVTYNVVDYLWKNILSQEAQNRMTAFVPTEYNNVKIDASGFLYATTSTIDSEDLAKSITADSFETKYSPVKRLNPTGNDVLIRKGYFSTVGDVSFKFDSLGMPETSVIEDVALGPNGRYTILDSRKNRIFTYSSDGELIYAFSGNGYQAGNSKTPVAITYRGTDLILLDQATGTVTVFAPTQYGLLIDDAYACYKQYDYEKSVGYWDQVLEENANFDIAFDGIGNALMQEERYQEAMNYFRYSNNKERYSTALGEHRATLIENYLLLFVAIAVVIIWLLLRLFKWIGKRNRDPKYADKHGTFLNQVLYAFYIMIHPFDGFWDVKHEKRGSVKAATVIAGGLALMRIISKFFTNYLFNSAYGTKISIINEIAIVAMPLLLWTLANWCVTTLADGEGSMKDVYVFTCYSLLPMALFTLLTTVLSHLIILDETMYLTFFNSVGLIWTGFLLFSGNTQTHRYSVGKSLLSILLAVVGMAIIVFLVLVIFTTYQQIYGFIDSIVKEVTYRI